MAKSSGGGSSLMTLGLMAVGGYFLYEYFFAPAATAAVALPAPGGTATSPATSTAAPPSTPGAVAGGSPAPAASAPSQLDTIYAALKVAAQPDTSFTGGGDLLTGLPYHWNSYLSMVYSGTIPDPAPLFDVNVPITAAAYWAKMAPALKAANTGLSGGLGCYGAAGAFLQGLGAYRW